MTFFKSRYDGPGAARMFALGLAFFALIVIAVAVYQFARLNHVTLNAPANDADGLDAAWADGHSRGDIYLSTFDVTYSIHDANVRRMARSLSVLGERYECLFLVALDRAEPFSVIDDDEAREAAEMFCRVATVFVHERNGVEPIPLSNEGDAPR